ncbi:hypothetical protein ACFFWC_22475 [Plantactinospora siamensis]|uniref:HEAT repeat domain-containing protein n=1 Tax=Plantactinospora siamensis TaxID=555372 RepID=A0ABV6NYH1_9ACTN
MPQPSTPRQRAAAECARRGRSEFVAGCVRLVLGDESELDLVRALTGGSAAKYLDGREHQDTYWFRVWGMRALLWEWDASATDAVRAGLTDEAWRVREMAAKVIARHLVGDLTESVATLRADPVPRVRAAAERALARLLAAGA